MSHTPAYTVIQTPEADKLADIRDVSVNKDLPREERIAEFIRQIRDPYHFKCGRFVVRASFSQEGATLEECLRGILRYTLLIFFILGADFSRMERYNKHGKGIEYR